MSESFLDSFECGSFFRHCVVVVAQSNAPAPLATGARLPVVVVRVYDEVPGRVQLTALVTENAGMPRLIIPQQIERSADAGALVTNIQFAYARHHAAAAPAAAAIVIYWIMSRFSCETSNTGVFRRRDDSFLETIRRCRGY